MGYSKQDGKEFSLRFGTSFMKQPLLWSKVLLMIAVPFTRTHSRCLTDDQIRQEVESEIGGPPGCPAWEEALTDAISAAECNPGSPPFQGFSALPSKAPSHPVPPSLATAAHKAHAALQDSPAKAMMHR